MAFNRRSMASLWLALALGCVLATNGRGGPAPELTGWQQDAPLAAKFCASPAFKKLSCAYNGIMGPEEEAAVIVNQSPLSGTLYEGLPTGSKLPATVGSVPMYNQIHLALASLACKGPAVVRAVFKLTQSGPKDCAHVRLEGADLDSTPTVRCVLSLPPGAPGEPEAKRALRATEAKCYRCTHCSEPESGGCPSKVGQWYADSYVDNLPGCAFDRKKGYVAYRAGMDMNPGTEILLAKFEVCQAPSCFNPAYEALKYKTALKCVKGVCPP